ncbi:MAG: hypothetical protein NVS2B8_10120 [Vulcanimicrobiaceae bacterium]
MSARLNDDEVARTRAFWMANRPNESGMPAYVPDPPLWWHVALALAFALLVQTSFAPFIAVRGATISFVTLVVAWYGVRAGVARGLAFGAVAGACEDALGGGTGAGWTIATALAGAGAGRFARTWVADTTLALVPAIALVTFVRFFLFATVMRLEGHHLALATTHLKTVLWQSALDALVAFIALRYLPVMGDAPAHRR